MKTPTLWTNWLIARVDSLRIVILSHFLVTIQDKSYRFILSSGTINFNLGVV